MTRKRIPNKTEGELIFKSDFKCCVCNKKGDHIHHIDSNPNNNDIDNLALLCFEHHDLATIKNSLSKKLSKDAIIEYRQHHYQVISKKRQETLANLDNPVIELSTEILLTISKNALIMLKLEKIKSKYFSATWENRPKILKRLEKYYDHANPRLAYDIFRFLNLASSQTKIGMTEENASIILSNIISFYPQFDFELSKIQSNELAKECITIGENITYDSLIHLKKLSIAIWGLTIIKHIYKTAKRNKQYEILEEVRESYRVLALNLDRPERNDLSASKEFLDIFRNDLDNSNLSHPKLPDYIFKIIENERNNNR
jgi:hypothetical protein